MIKLTKKYTIDHFNKIVLEIADKYNITTKEAETILRSQFEFLLLEIQSDNFCNVKLKHIGKFLVNEKRKDKYINRHNKTNSGRLEESNITNNRNKEDKITTITS